MKFSDLDYFVLNKLSLGSTLSFFSRSKQIVTTKHYDSLDNLSENEAFNASLENTSFVRSLSKVKRFNSLIDLSERDKPVLPESPFTSYTPRCKSYEELVNFYKEFDNLSFCLDKISFYDVVVINEGFYQKDGCFLLEEDNIFFNALLKAFPFMKDALILPFIRTTIDSFKDPEGEQIDLFRSLILEELSLIKPKFVIVMGRLAVQGLFVTTAHIGELKPYYDITLPFQGRFFVSPALDYFMRITQEKYRLYQLLLNIETGLNDNIAHSINR